MDTLTSLKVFRQVVESGSFVGAAERLELSTAMVSKHVMCIERRLGSRLLNRTSRALSLTEPGSMYYTRCKGILDDLEATELELASLRGNPKGTVRVSAPSWFAGRILTDALIEFRRRYPEIVVDISFEDGEVDVVNEGYDLAFRVSRDLSSMRGELIARPICPIRSCIGASREYLRRRGSPRSPEDLGTHDCVACETMESWALTGPEGTTQVPARVVARYRSIAGVASAVAAGLGLAPLPTILFHEPTFKDTLVPVLPQLSMQQATMYALYPTRKYSPPKVRAFVDFAIEWSARRPAINRGVAERLMATATA